MLRLLSCIIFKAPPSEEQQGIFTALKCKQRGSVPDEAKIMGRYIECQVGASSGGRFLRDGGNFVYGKTRLTAEPVDCTIKTNIILVYSDWPCKGFFNC